MRCFEFRVEVTPALLAPDPGTLEVLNEAGISYVLATSISSSLTLSAAWVAAAADGTVFAEGFGKLVT